MNNKVGFACSTSLVFLNQLILFKHTTLYLRDTSFVLVQRFVEQYSSSGVKSNARNVVQIISQVQSRIF